MDTFNEISFLKQKFEAVINYGTIDATKAGEGKALARVKIGDRVTDFLPVKMIANSFAKVWIPPRVGEQVVVISPLGDPSSGFIVPSIYNIDCREPDGANAENVIIEIGENRFEVDRESVYIKAPEKITLDTPLVETTGELKANGNISNMLGVLTAILP